MTGLDKIISEIGSDSSQRIKEISDEANKKAEEISLAAEKKASCVGTTVIGVIAELTDLYTTTIIISM